MLLGNWDVDQNISREVKRFTPKLLEKQSVVEQIIGESPPIQCLKQKIQRLAKFDVNVLLEGEPGTGKELCARVIHYLSQRADKQFVAVNCAAVPETLFESIFFGHKRGSFTDAKVDQKGLIDEAHGGTLFLDEVGELALPAQAKLLRVLQDGTFHALGDSQMRVANFRIIAATNRCLKMFISQSAFRCDLYGRLAEYVLHLPPLRDRGNDIFMIADTILKRLCTAYHLPHKFLSEEVKIAFLEYSWENNVRELENVLKYAVIESESDKISLKDLPDSFHKPSHLPRIKEVIVTTKRQLIEKALLEFNGNITRAAAAIGMERRALGKSIKNLGINVERFKVEHLNTVTVAQTGSN